MRIETQRGLQQLLKRYKQGGIEYDITTIFK